MKVSHSILRPLSPYGTAFLACLLFINGCGLGAGGREDHPQHLRIIHALPKVAAISIDVDDSSATASSTKRVVRGARTITSLLKGVITIGDLGYRDASDYMQVTEGKNTITVHREGDVGAILSETQTFENAKAYSYVVYPDGTSFKSVLQTDDRDGPTGDQFGIRIANFAPSAGSVDVYIYKSSISLAKATAVVSGLAMAKFSDYLKVDLGKYRVTFTKTGKRAAVEDFGEISLEAGETATIILFDKKKGGTPLTSSLYMDKSNS